MLLLRPFMFGILLLLAGCNSDSVYILYRTSVFDQKARVYVATVGNGESDEHNQENGKTAMDLFNGQRRIVTRFWCEKGDFKK